MSKFLLAGNWEFPAFPLLDKFVGDGLASEKGGVISVVVEEVKQNKVALSKDSKEVDIQHYFEGVLELAKSDKEFPINFDEVWMLAYKDKRSAIHELKDKFVQDFDYKTVRKKIQSSNVAGYTYAYDYFLTVSCMEYFVARRVKAVFEVYRRVFHGVAKMAQQYAVPSYQEQDPIKRAERWIEEEKVRQALMLENKEQKKQLEESSKEIVALSSTITQMQPKVTYYDTILANKSTVKVSQIAQDYGMSAQAFNKLLLEHKLQRKVGKQWILYRQFLDKGYVHSEPIPIEHHDGSQTYNYLTVWTQKGRIFLYDFLKRFDVLPMIERSDSGEAHK